MVVLMTETDIQDLSPDGAFLTALVERYIDMLKGEEVPLTSRISVVAVLDDLFRLAEIPTPQAVSLTLGLPPR